MLTAEEVRRVLDYDAETGTFTWKVAVGRRIKAGEVAGSAKGCTSKNRTQQYVRIRLYGKVYQAHRLAWLFVYGVWPRGLLDHRDGNGKNNAIGNLRECNDSLNQANAKKHSRNTSGFKGVTFHKRTKVYRARICVNGCHLWLGQFKDKRAAYEAYVNAAKLHFGDFARVA